VVFFSVLVTVPLGVSVTTLSLDLTVPFGLTVVVSVLEIS